VVPSTGGEAKQVSFLGNSFGGNVYWAKDGRSIYFSTAQRTEDTYIAKIDLVPQQPKFREDQFRDLFVEPQTDKNTQPKKDTSSVSVPDKPNTSSKPAAVRIVWEGLRERLNWVPVGVDVNEFLLSKDGNTIVLTTSNAGQQNIYTWSVDELSKDAGTLKQITTTAPGKRDIQISNDGKDVYYIEGGKIQAVSPESKTVRAISITAEMDIDFNKEKMEMFRQAWDSQNEGFYDENFHGANWTEIKKTYEPYAAGAQTGDELRRILSLMVGELNASHSGVAGPTGSQLVTGRTGLRFDRIEYENNGKLKITEIVPFSPAGLSDQIKPGDYLLAVDGKPIEANTNLDQVLENKTGKKTLLKISSSANGQNPRDITIRPVSTGTEKGLLYKQWVQQRRDYVNRISNGRLGYVHMFDMGQGSLDQLYLDMDAENHSKEGVVIDVRNNNGGFVNAYALDVLSRKGYLNMQRRGLPNAPARVQLGQRALDAPTVLVTNQHSLSDAEDFTEGYRAMGLGKVVGEPTAGWIIYTSSYGLIDGSSVRMPFIKITDNKGMDMELHPRPVDIAVTNPVGEKERDRQLDVAVKTLLEQVDTNRKK
jgi:C-terminal processing protease CtpA/Prc